MTECPPITGRDGSQFQVRPLVKHLARLHGPQLLQIHNIIPYVSWELGDLLADADAKKGVEYVRKWQLSLAVFAGNKPIGLLIAYARPSSDKHPIEAIYIHRLAVTPAYQGNNIGSQLLRTAFDYYAREFPQYTTYTVQTNDEPANEHVIGFYEQAGFKRFRPVEYPDKLDVLMKLERAEIPATLQTA